MASIRKRGTSYEVRISLGRDSLGKKIEDTSTFKPDPKWSESRALKEVEKYAVLREERLRNGGCSSGDKITFEKFSKQFLADMEESKSLAETTLYDYRHRLDAHIIPAIGQLKLTQITNRVVNTFLKQLRQDGVRQDGKDGALKESTITKERATISSILSYAVEQGYLSINPIIFSGKQRGRNKATPEYKTKQLSIDQAKCFLWLLDNPVMIKGKAHTSKRGDSAVPVKEYSQLWSLDLKWKVFFYFAIFTGARRGELVSLLWSDLDFKTNTVRFSKSTAKVPGKTIHKDTKTHATRQCIVPSIAMDLARQLLFEQKKECLRLGDYWKGSRGDDFMSNFIFIREDGTQMHLDSPRTEFKRLIRIYNTNVAKNDSEALPHDLTLHDLRHTTASILINKKLDPRSVSGVLGHANTSTTLNIYAYFFHQTSQDAVNIMEDALFEHKQNSRHA